MVLILHDPNPTFTGLVLQIHTPMSQGIFDLSGSSAQFSRSVTEFFENRGVMIAIGYRPGIGGASGGQAGLVSHLLRTAPLIGKSIRALLGVIRIVRQKLADYKKKKMRPFRPSLGLHLEIWPAPDRRQRSNVSPLVETLDLLPALISHMESKHSDIALTFLITANSPQRTLPPIRIDSDACETFSLMGLASKIQKDLMQENRPTHYSLVRSWGVRNKVVRYYDATDIMDFVFLFPKPY